MYLTNNKVPFNKVEVKCDCGKIIQLPVPKSKFEEGIANVDVNQSLIDGHLDYLFTSKLSVPSIDQPGHRGCIYTGILKWTYNKRAFKKINTAYLDIGFVELHKMVDMHTRMLFGLYSYNFISTNICYDMFKEIFDQRMEEFSEEIVFDEDFIAEDEFSLLAE